MNALLIPENWTLVGLVLDIVGFSILLFEAWKASFGDEEFMPLSEEMTGHKAWVAGTPNERRIRLAKPTMSSDIQKAFNQVDDFFDEQEDMERMNDGGNWYVRELALPRRRRFILLGGTLVILGFCFQIVGAYFS